MSSVGDEAPFAEVEALFARTRRLSAQAREEALGQVAPAVAAEVRALLSEHDAEGPSFLDRPALGAGFRLDDAAGARLAGLPERVGRYRVRGLIGEGGMGTVYLAEQDQPRREVALKVIRARVVTPALRGRFEREAEALGRLRHPGIAQIYDAGLDDDGRPYIAMERVQGRSLLDHASHAGLDRGARLALFARVCDAVEHAHQKGVVHRDLKPGNILVEEHGSQASRALQGGTTSATTFVGAQPRILDFGVARVSDAELRSVTGATRDGQLVGTLDAMSPEQAAGRVDDVDTRSDVYALGLILFELLAGRPAFELAGRPLLEAVAVIQHEEPPRLGAVDATLAGDLETIVAKALEKDRERRYPSAAALADDVRRFLADEPILAHPPSILYQLSKFVRRHRLLVAMLGAVAASLLVGLVALLFQWRQTRAASDLAERRFAELQSLAGDVLSDVDGALLYVPGALTARRRIVETALAYLEPLAAEAGDDVELLRTLVRGYARVGDIQGQPGVPNLGDADGARTSWSRALALLDRIEALGQAPSRVARDRHDLLARLGDLARAQGDAAVALGLYERAQAAWRVAASTGDVRQAQALPLRERVADVLTSLGRGDEADAQRRLAAEEARELAEASPDDWMAQRAVMVSAIKRAMQAEDDGAPAEALALYDEAAGIAAALLADRPDHAVLRRDLASIHGRWGDALLELSRREEARAHHALALAGHEALYAADPGDAGALMDLCGAVNRDGEMALEEQRLDEALVRFRRFDALTEALLQLDAGRADHLRRRGVALYKLGEVHAALAEASDDASARDQRWHVALGWFERCLAHFLDMQTQGRLAAADAAVPEDVRGRIASCQEALDAEAGDG